METAKVLMVEDLHKAIVVVPNYQMVKSLSANLLKLSGSNVVMLPKFFTLPDLYEYLQAREGRAYHSATILEKKVILSSVLRSHDITLAALDEYFVNIERYNKHKSLSPSFMKVMDNYTTKLAENNINAPTVLDINQLRWLIGQVTERLFIIPTLENFSDLSEIKAPNLTVLPLPALNLIGALPIVEAIAKAYCSDYYQAECPEVTTIEYQNKFELVRALAQDLNDLGQACVIIESDEIRTLLCKELGIYNESLVETHAFKLFYSLASYAFDMDNIDYLIEIAINPVSIFCNPQNNWLRESHDLRPANSIILSKFKEIDFEKTTLLEQLHKLPTCTNFVEALKVNTSIFMGLLSHSSCEAYILFEMQQFLKDLEVCLSENTLKFSPDYLDFITTLARGHAVGSISSDHINLLDIKRADYQEFERIIIIENGISKLEKRAQEEGEESFARLCTRLIWLCKAKSIRVMRAINASDEESIFYTLLKSSYVASMNKQPHFGKRLPIAQPEVKLEKELRPIQYSVTEITKLLSDPYSYYAEYILRLRPQDRIWEASESRDFGILAHSVLSKLGDDCINYSEVIEAALKPYELTNSAKLLWKQKLKTVVEFVQSYYAENPVKQYFAECKGSASLLCADDKVIITARADRIDIDLNGETTIIDFKTGYAPAQAEVDTGKAPQLAIESWIARNKGFAQVAQSHQANAKYIAVSGRASTQSIRSIKLDDDLTESSLVELFTRFYAASESYFATHKSEGSSTSKFAHLKRLDEWFDNIAV